MTILSFFKGTFILSFFKGAFGLSIWKILEWNYFGAHILEFLEQGLEHILRI